MGLFLALAVPLEAPRNSVSLSYFFEATYGLPQNSTAFPSYEDRGDRKKRGIDRATIYRTVENKFTRSGFRGRECLLRTICETSESSLHHNGVLGDIINVIFTPSTSRAENLPRDILEAEIAGRADSCSKYYSGCPVGLYDSIGILVTTGCMNGVDSTPRSFFDICSQYTYSQITVEKNGVKTTQCAIEGFNIVEQWHSLQNCIYKTGVT